MTLSGWLQIALFCAVVLALVKPLGLYMTRVFTGASTPLSPVLRPIEPASTPRRIDERHEQHWLTYAGAMLVFHAAGFVLLYGILRLQNLLPFNPADQSAVAPDLAFKHRRELRHQHQLAELRRREHPLLPLPDAGADAPELPLGGDRHRARRGADPGFRPASARTVGSFWVDLTRCTLYVLLPLCIVYTLFLVWQGVRRRWRPTPRRRPGRGQADHRPRPGGEPGGDQDARHQWRRLLQRQCRPPVREPDRVVEPHPDGVDLRTRPRSPTWFGAAWSGTSARAGRSSPRWACCSSPAPPSPTGRGRRQPALNALGLQAATSRARSCASASPARRSSRW